MDKVKAIKVLKPLVESYVDYANITMKEEDDDIVEALEMAIEALKALDVPDMNVGDMISRQMAIDLFPDDDLEYDTKGGYVAPHLARQMICELPFVQPDHVADVSKKEDMMHEYIYKIVKDCDGVYCYIKQGEMIRCNECEHWKNEHLCESLSRFGSFETKADFHCGYAERRTDV